MFTQRQQRPTRMSIIGAPSLDDVLKNEVAKFEKEISAQHVKAVRLQMKNDACETKEKELRINLRKAEKELADWNNAHGGLSAQPAFDQTANKMLKTIVKLKNDIMKTNGVCGISKRDMVMAQAIKAGMEKALKDFKRTHRLT
jgi:hypothetical protein